MNGTSRESQSQHRLLVCLALGSTNADNTILSIVAANHNDAAKLYWQLIIHFALQVLLILLRNIITL